MVYFDLGIDASFGPMLNNILLPFYVETYMCYGDVEIERVCEDTAEFVRRFENDEYGCQSRYLLLQISHHLCELMNHMRDFDQLSDWIEQSRIAKHENDKGVRNDI